MSVRQARQALGLRRRTRRAEPARALLLADLEHKRDIVRTGVRRTLTPGLLAKRDVTAVGVWLRLGTPPSRAVTIIESSNENTQAGDTAEHDIIRRPRTSVAPVDVLVAQVVAAVEAAKQKTKASLTGRAHGERVHVTNIREERPHGRSKSWTAAQR